MSRYVRIVLVLVLVLIALPVLPASAESLPSQLPDGCVWVPIPLPPDTPSSVGIICMPPDGGVPWNGDLVIFAHGYVGPEELPEKGFEQLLLPGEPGAPPVWVPGMLTAMGYAFAATSYRVNGLAIQYGVEDLVLLRDAFFTLHNPLVGATPPRTYVIGVSEGGLIATQAIEKNPNNVFSGGLACCGPIGDFRQQINYWGDFRVVYDYFFTPGLTKYGGSAMDITTDLTTAWAGGSAKQEVLGALQAYPDRAMQLMKVTRAAYDPKDLNTIGLTVVGILDYSVYATMDGITKLGGIPFSNKYTWYYGSSNDKTLNLKVERVTASQDAIKAINASYQTTGKLTKPLVTMHTTGDPIVPYWHEVLYQLKTWKNRSSANHINIPILRYGHCNFTAAELQFGFGLLVFKVTRAWPAGAEQALPNAGLREQFRSLKANSANVVKPAVE